MLWSPSQISWDFNMVGEVHAASGKCYRWEGVLEESLREVFRKDMRKQVQHFFNNNNKNTRKHVFVFILNFFLRICFQNTALDPE